jgi:hypothetical protein
MIYLGQPFMNDITYTQLRKKISRRAVILAVILILSLTFTLLPALFNLPPFGAFIFSPIIWGKIGVVNGSYFEITISILFFILCIFPLLLWGATYQEKPQYTLRLRIWYTFFAVLLGYSWLMSLLIHAIAIFPVSREPMPSGMLPLPYEARDHIISSLRNEPSLLSWEFVLYLIPLIIYTAESLYMLWLLRKARKYQATMFINEAAPSTIA